MSAYSDIMKKKDPGKIGERAAAGSGYKHETIGMKKDGKKFGKSAKSAKSAKK